MSVELGGSEIVFIEQELEKLGGVLGRHMVIGAQSR